jgi:hypothetical protein
MLRCRRTAIGIPGASSLIMLRGGCDRRGGSKVSRCLSRYAAERLGSGMSAQFVRRTSASSSAVMVSYCVGKRESPWDLPYWQREHGARQSIQHLLVASNGYPLWRSTYRRGGHCEGTWFRQCATRATRLGTSTTVQVPGGDLKWHARHIESRVSGKKAASERARPQQRRSGKDRNDLA